MTTHRQRSSWLVWLLLTLACGLPCLRTYGARATGEVAERAMLEVLASLGVVEDGLLTRGLKAAVEQGTVDRFWARLEADEQFKQVHELRDSVEQRLERLREPESSIADGEFARLQRSVNLLAKDLPADTAPLAKIGDHPRVFMDEPGETPHVKMEFYPRPLKEELDSRPQIVAYLATDEPTFTAVHEIPPKPIDLERAEDVATTFRTKLGAAVLSPAGRGSEHLDRLVRTFATKKKPLVLVGEGGHKDGVLRLGREEITLQQLFDLSTKYGIPIEVLNCSTVGRVSFDDLASAMRTAYRYFEPGVTTLEAFTGEVRLNLQGIRITQTAKRVGGTAAVVVGAVVVYKVEPSKDASATRPSGRKPGNGR